MKVTIKSLLILCLIGVFTSQLHAQKIKEGVATFDISYPELTKEMKEMEGMLPRSMSVHFKNDQSRTEMSMGGGKTTSISSASKKEIIVLMDMMGKKLALKQNAADLQKKIAEQKKAGQYPTDVKVVKSAETKMIAGYKCQKSTVTYKMGGAPERMDCYYTMDLPKSVNNLDNPALQGIEGFMMEYNISQGGMKMRIKANSVKAQPVAERMFTVPSDYKVLTLEELQQMMSGGGK